MKFLVLVIVDIILGAIIGINFWHVILFNLTAVVGVIIILAIMDVHVALSAVGLVYLAMIALLVSICSYPFATALLFMVCSQVAAIIGEAVSPTIR